jgi:tRNA threonylcarbamoyladenosine biosynthesis protein TsaB
MLLLGIETSTSRSSIALVDQDRVLASASLGLPRRHGEFLAPALKFCLTQAGLTVDRIHGVAVGVGPGLYTGLRVGIATAQAFAAARDLPVVGTCGLDVLAFRHRHSRRVICATIDARRGEIFWALYRPVPGGVQRIGEVRLGTEEALVADLEGIGEPSLVIGDAGPGSRAALRRVADVAAPTWPDAADVAELAHERFVREETERPEQLTPLYLRQADAAIGWQARGRLHGETRDVSV